MTRGKWAGPRSAASQGTRPHGTFTVRHSPTPSAWPSPGCRRAGTRFKRASRPRSPRSPSSRGAGRRRGVEMPLPDGFEFVVREAVPLPPGIRQVDARTFEVHPDAYAALVAVFDRPAEMCRVLAGMLESYGALDRALQKLDETFGQASDP